MKESQFIRQNKAKWENIEAELQKKKEKADPDEMSKVFIEITDDLSYARTFFPNRAVRVYLNTLAQKVFGKIYRQKRLNGSVISRFFTYDLPLTIFQCRWYLLLSFLIFSIAFGIGVFSSIQDEDFSRLILGDQYVAMTNANVADGDAMKVYKQGKQMDGFVRILLNNARIDFLVFALGLFFGIGSLFVLIYNGVMVGTFQYFFYPTDYFWESVTTIWLHGTLEISTIIISGASGIVAGSGLLFPGTYSRIQAFKLSAKKGLKIMVGILPVTVLAAGIESFITGSEAHVYLKIGLILISLAFVIFYFLYYPFKLFYKRDQIPVPKQELGYQPPINLELNKIKPNGEILSQGFDLYIKQLGRFFFFALIGIGLYLLTLHYFYHESFYFKSKVRSLSLPLIGNLNLLDLSAYFNAHNIFSLISGVGLILFASVPSIAYLQRVFRPKNNINWVQCWVSGLIASVLFVLPLWVDNGWFTVLYNFLALSVLLPLTFKWLEGKLQAESKTANVAVYLKMATAFLSINILIQLLRWVLILFCGSQLMQIVEQSLFMTLDLSDAVFVKVSFMLKGGLSLLFYLLIYPLFIILTFLYFFVLKERVMAVDLTKQLSEIGRHEG